jgi:hypothetical protein
MGITFCNPLFLRDSRKSQLIVGSCRCVLFPESMLFSYPDVAGIRKKSASLSVPKPIELP